MKNFIKKHWLLLTLIIITIIRFSLSYKLPSYYLLNMDIDDKLMIEQGKSLLAGEYLGTYSNTTLIKGIVFPLFLATADYFNISYSILLTILYILACIFFTKSIKPLIKNKFLQVFIYLLLLFNPISYSLDLFQRLYRNSLSVIEALFFFSFVIRIINEKNIKKNIINGILLGIIMGFLYLTREDNIWCIAVVIILMIYKFLENKSLKNIIVQCLPIITLNLILNSVSLINYKYYNIYTYNELIDSNFKDCYIKIQEIKGNRNQSDVSITKDNFYQLTEVSQNFQVPKEKIDEIYTESKSKKHQEIDNGRIIWAFRNMVYETHHFKDGKEANEYFKNLALEIEELFESKTLEKEPVIPSVFINTTKIKNFKNLPKNIVKSIIYTTTYKNVRTVKFEDFIKLKNVIYNKKTREYTTYYNDYHYSENISKKNDKNIEPIRQIYQYFTIIFSIISLIIYIKNIKQFKTKNYIIMNLLIITYTLILLGINYTEITGFHAIRYYYLGNIYIIQNIFIILNLDNLNLKKLIKKH